MTAEPEVELTGGWRGGACSNRRLLILRWKPVAEEYSLLMGSVCGIA